MTLTASQCDSCAAPSTREPKPRPRTVAQMDQVKPSQIGIQSKLPGHAQASLWDSFYKHLSLSESSKGRWYSAISTVTSVLSDCKCVCLWCMCVSMHVCRH